MNEQLIGKRLSWGKSRGKQCDAGAWGWSRGAWEAVVVKLGGLHSLETTKKRHVKVNGSKVRHQRFLNTTFSTRESAYSIPYRKADTIQREVKRWQGFSYWGWLSRLDTGVEDTSAPVTREATPSLQKKPKKHIKQNAWRNTEKKTKPSQKPWHWILFLWIWPIILSYWWWNPTTQTIREFIKVKQYFIQVI